jgi:predicted MFS family arabinose efflux permease
MSQLAVPVRVHRAWIVAFAGFVALLAAAAIRATFGVLLMPLMDEFGWSRATISTAASINLVVFGLSAPFAAAFVERLGLRRVVVTALGLIVFSAAAMTAISQPWQLYVLWGLVAGIATGAVAPVLAAMIAGRWFIARRGLVVGMLTAANSTGQLVFLPLMSHLVEDGWRWTMAVVGGAAVVAMLVAGSLMRDRPSDIGLAPFGGEHEIAPSGPRPSALDVLRTVGGDPTFLALAGSFFVCGATTVGLIAVHLIPAAHDHGIPATEAAGLMAAMGVLDIAGTTGSGWLTDRYNARTLLAGYYVGRGLSLLLLPAALSAQGPTLKVFALFYGLDWIATVPPTVALANRRFGRDLAPIVFGWIFAAHQLGGAAAAWAAGFVRGESGTYDGVFLVSGALCIVAALIVSQIRLRSPVVAAVSGQA